MALGKAAEAEASPFAPQGASRSTGLGSSCLLSLPPLPPHSVTLEKTQDPGTSVPAQLQNFGEVGGTHVAQGGPRASKCATVLCHSLLWPSNSWPQMAAALQASGRGKGYMAAVHMLGSQADSLPLLPHPFRNPLFTSCVAVPVPATCWKAMPHSVLPD
jgi:hypothetical protein